MRSGAAAASAQAAAGAALALAFPPFDLWPVALAAPLPLLWAVTRPGASRRRAAAAGLWFGLAFFSSTIYWVLPVMRRYGGLGPLTSASVLAIFVLVLALFPAGFAVALRRVAAGRGPGVALALAPAAWVAVEFLRNHVFTGFPWVRLGTALHAAPAPLQLASLTGVYGLSALLLGTAAGVVRGLGAPRVWRSWAHLGVMVLVWAALATWGGRRVAALESGEDGERLRVGCVQGNVAQVDKRGGEEAGSITRRYLELTREALDGGAELVVWPESATPYPLVRDPALARTLEQLAEQHGAALLVGSLDLRAADGDRVRVYNSAFLYGADGHMHGRYDKVHLVPFGEYVPYLNLLLFTGSLVQEVGDMRPGSGEQSLTVLPSGAGVPGIGVLICYEIIFPDLSRRAVRAGAGILATLTNDAWFGRTSAPHQHFAEAVVRAVETGRWVVRAANTGISGVIAPTGEVKVRTRLDEAGLAMAEVVPRTEITPYVRLGDVFAWACAILAASVTALPARKTPAPGPDARPRE